MAPSPPFVALDRTFRGLTQSLLHIWNERNPDGALRSIQSDLLNELASQLNFTRPVSAAISMNDEKHNRLRFECAVGPLEAEIMGHHPRPHGVNAYVYQQRMPLIITHVERWPPEVPAPHPNLVENPHVRSLALYPLLIGEGADEIVIGVLTIIAQQPLDNRSQLEFALQIFADRVAIITQATRVHRRRLREEQALMEISQAAVNVDSETLSKVIARQAVTLTKSMYAVVFVVSRDRSELNSVGLTVARGLLPRGSSIHLPLRAKSINSRVFKTQRSYYAPDLANDPYYYHYRPWDEETGAAYCVPLKMRDVTVGTLYVASQNRNGFTKQDQDFVDQLAFHAASALRSTSLLQNVVHFQQVISDVLPTAEQFTRIRDELERLGFDTRGLLIATCSEENRLINFDYVWENGRSVDESDPLRRPAARYGPRLLGERRGLVDWVIRMRTSLLVKDFSQWTGHEQLDLDEYRDLTCCLVVPMFSQETVVGALGLRGYQQPHLFNEIDKQFLEVVANHIAVIINNAAAYSQEVSRLAFLQVVREIQENMADMLPIPQQMTQIRLELQRLGIDISGLFIATIDSETQFIELPKVYERGKLIPADAKVNDSRFAPRKIGARRGLIDWCIQHHPKPILVTDFEQWEHRREIEPAYADGIRCFLMAPMYHNDKLIGVIGLRGYERPHMFDATHQNLLTAIADFMAIVVENAQLYDRALKKLELSNRRLKRRLEVSRALSDFQREISDVSSREKEIEDIWESLRRTLRKVNVDLDNLYLAIMQNGEITFPRVLEEGKPADLSSLAQDYPYRTRPLGTRNDLTEWVIRHGEAKHFQNRQEFIDFKQAHADVLQIPQYSRSWLGVPIKKGDTIFGMIGLRSFKDEYAFDKPLEEFMISIANHAAIVFDNAQLFDSIQYEAMTAKALATASRVIASAGLETERVLQTILQQAVEVTGARFGTLQLIEDDSLAMVAVWPQSVEEIVLQKLERVCLDSQSITTRAIRENDAQLVSDVSLDPDYYAILPEIQSELAVVLRGVRESVDGVIGVINVEHERQGGLTGRHRQLLIDLAHSASVAIDYAKQYQALERARDIGLASTAIAWLGLFGADWQHTINQKTFSISNYVTGLKLYLQEVAQAISGVNNLQGIVSSIDALAEGLQRIQTVADEIREVKFTHQVQLPPSISESLSIGERYDRAVASSSGACAVDSELPKMINLWCRKEMGVQVVYDLGCEKIQIGIATQWLKVALEKLVHNALQAMPHGGRLTIKTRCDAKQVQISICDTGSGIPENVRDLFLRRAIPKETHENGSGLGAMIARFVALSHGGDLKLNDHFRRGGTELIMTLPIKDLEEESSASGT